MKSDPNHDPRDDEPFDGGMFKGLYVAVLLYGILICAGLAIWVIVRAYL